MDAFQPIDAKGFTKKFADVAAFPASYQIDLKCQVFREANGKDSGAPRAGNTHVGIITQSMNVSYR